jgi:hypothetical protein
VVRKKIENKNKNMTYAFGGLCVLDSQRLLPFKIGQKVDIFFSYMFLIFLSGCFLRVTFLTYLNYLNISCGIIYSAACSDFTLKNIIAVCFQEFVCKK